MDKMFKHWLKDILKSLIAFLAFKDFKMKLLRKNLIRVLTRWIIPAAVSQTEMNMEIS
jgi:hypothetical protein